MRSELDWPTEPQSFHPSFDIKRMLWGRKWLLLFLAIAGCGVGYIQFTKEPEVFASSARVMVERDRPVMPVEGMQEIQVKDPIETHLELIRTPVILEGAIQSLEPLQETVPDLARRGNPMMAIAAGLRASRTSTQSSIIDITYVSSSRGDCKAVVDAVIQSYRAYLGDSQQVLSDRMIKLVSDAEGKLREELAGKEASYQKFRQTASLLWNGAEGQNIHQGRMSKIESDRAGMLIRQSEIKAELDAIDAAMKRGTSRNVLLLVADKLRSASGVADSSATSPRGLSATSDLLPLLLDEALLLEKVGPGHPDVRQIRKKIEVMERLLRKESGDEIAGPVDPLALYMQSLTEELRITDQKVAELNRLFLDERESARLLGSEENQNRVLLEDIQRTKDLYDEVLDKLEQINLVKSGNHFTVRMVAPASGAGKIGPNRDRFLTMGALGGLMMGVVLSFLLELSDRSFRSPSEITQVLRTPVIGHIPRIDAERGGRVVRDDHIDSTVATYHRPNSRAAEAYRGVRSSMLFGLKGQNHKVIQITSPDPGDGKSTLAANLATAMAGSGKRVLLIDVDLRKPRQHKIFGASRDIGVTSVLLEKHELPDAIQATNVPNLSLLSAGPKVDHPGELLLSPRFEQMIQVLREHYDFIVVDTPPVLAVTDAATVATLVDGVLLVFRISKRSRPHATKAVEALQMIGAKLLGIVVNGLGEYSSYHYGVADYGYGYGNSYLGQYGNDEPSAPTIREAEQPASSSRS